jgi:hypothetical protein
MDPVWSPSTIEIKTLVQPNVYTLWLYKKAFEREQIVQKESAHYYLLNEKELQIQSENKLRLKNEALQKELLINQLHKKKIEIRINNDGSICKFLY